MDTSLDTGVFPARHWHALPDGRLQCDVCPRLCRLHDGQRGEADGLFPEGFADLDSAFSLLSVAKLQNEWATWTQLIAQGEFAGRAANRDEGRVGYRGRPRR